MLSSLLESSLQTLLNHYLSLDKQLEQKLKPLRGKILEIQIKKTPFHYGFLFTKDRIDVIAANKITADATICGDVWVFLQVMRSSSLSNLSKLTITGDHAFSEAAYHVLRDLEIDWEEILSKYTGDVMAHKIGQGVKSIKEWLDRGRDSFTLSVTEYVQEELRYFPAPTEVHDFMNDVDEIKNDLERLTVRLAPYLQDKHD